MRERDGTKRKGSLLDLFLILLLALCLVGLGLRYSALRQKTDEGELVGYRVVMTVKGVPSATASCLAEGDALYTISGEQFGILESVVTSPARVRLYSDGVYYDGEWSEDILCDMEVSVTVSGEENGAILLRNGTTAILCGQTLTLCSTLAALPFTVLEYAPISAQNGAVLS